MRNIALIVIVLLVLGCQKENDKYWVAKYDDYVLTKADILNVIPADKTGDDSIQFVNDYIERWAKDKVLMHKRDSFLSEEEISKIDLQVEKYREDLIAITIEDKLVVGFSDAVSEEELQAYYDKFPDTFVLDKDIITYRFMQIPDDSVSNYKRLLRQGSIDELKSKLEAYGYYHEFTDDNWIETDKLLQADILPDKIKNYPLMSGNQIYTATENGTSFILEVVEVGREGKQAPFSYIKPTIKSVVLNKRKLNLLSQKKNELYEKALENDEIKRN